MNYGVLVIQAYVVVYEDVLNIVVKGVDPQRLPSTNRVGVTHPPGNKKHGWMKGWRSQRHNDGGLRTVMRTSQSGPESLPGPGRSSGTGTGLFLHREWTRALCLGSGRLPSCCSGCGPGSYSHLTEPRATRGVREGNKDF